MVDPIITSKQAGMLRAVCAKDGNKTDKAVLEYIEYGANGGYFEKVEKVTVSAFDRVLSDLRRRRVID